MLQTCTSKINMFLYLLLIVISLCILHVILNYNARARLIGKIPGPKRDFIIGNGLTFVKSPVESMKQTKKYADSWDGIYSVWIYPYGFLAIYNPDDIEILLSGTKHADKSFIYYFLKSWLQDGLLVSNGSKWQERRKILTPAFHYNILKQFCDILDQNGDQFIESLQDSTGTPIDLLPVLSEFTLNSICETAMGTQLSKDTTGAAKSYKNALYELGNFIFQRLIRVYLYPDFLFNLSSWGRKQQAHITTVRNFTESVIEQRKEYIKKNKIDINAILDDDDNTYIYNNRKKTAMLDLLLSAEKEGLINKTGIQEEVDTFMFEGHDTTASALTFCFMLLANHKNVQDKIREELSEIFGNSKRPMKPEDLSKMKYLDCCIKESLRMYPPVHFISRNLNETTKLSNYTVPAGTICNIYIINLHYRESIFKNPQRFDPDRFLPKNCAGRHPFAYIPFSAGTRNCIGQKFAMMEMKIAVAKVLRDFNLEPVTRPEDIRLSANIVLRNDGPVFVNFVKRH